MPNRAAQNREKRKCDRAEKKVHLHRAKSLRPRRRVKKGFTWSQRDKEEHPLETHYYYRARRQKKKQVRTSIIKRCVHLSKLNLAEEIRKDNRLRHTTTEPGDRKRRSKCEVVAKKDAFSWWHKQDHPLETQARRQKKEQVRWSYNNSCTFSLVLVVKLVLVALVVLVLVELIVLSEHAIAVAAVVWYHVWHLIWHYAYVKSTDWYDSS